MVVLGSGLGCLAEWVEQPIRIPYQDIPGFQVPTVAGHRGELVAGSLGGASVLVQSGRFHLYEGYGADQVALPVRVAARLGVDTLVVTNAAGGVRPGLDPGTIMLIADHLNLTGRNPLLGPQHDGEERFPDLSAAYDPALRSVARAAAARLGIPLAEGIYAGLLGPSYETPAEVRMLHTLGADAVGMSTVVEVIAARALGLRCLGLSIITNPGAGQSPTPLAHTEVMQIAERTGHQTARLIEAILGEIG
jgi:purine-nucleoside phosphorylase